MLRAVLYLRLSSSTDDSTAIVRQEEDLRALAAREGWSVELVLTDDGISGRKARANAAEALRMLRDGEADVLAVWKLDRWTRQGLGAIGDLSETLEAVPGALFVALQDGLRSDQASWRIIAAVLSEVARAEADNTAKRVKSSIAHRRTVADRYTGGSTIPFGYESTPAPDGVGRVLVPNAAEAAVVREVAARLLSTPVSQTRVAKDLTAAGVPTSRSPRRVRRNRTGVDAPELSAGFWRTHSVREIWTSDNLLGRVTHGGQLVRDANGLPRSVWEPLIDRATLEQLRNRLASVPRKTPNRPKAARLLSGVAYCADCENRMYVSTSGGRLVYRCATSRDYDECKTFPRVDAVHLEQLVSATFLQIVGGADETTTLSSAEDSEVEVALAEVAAALQEATAALAEDDADSLALMRRITALKSRRAELRAQPTTVVTETIIPTGRSISEAWDAAPDDDTRRAYLGQFLDHITVAAATNPDRRSQPIDPHRVGFRWHAEVGAI